MVGRDGDGTFQAKRIEEMASPNYAHRLNEREDGIEQDGLDRVATLEPTDDLEKGLKQWRTLRSELDRFWSVRQLDNPAAA